MNMNYYDIPSDDEEEAGENGNNSNQAARTFVRKVTDGASMSPVTTLSNSSSKPEPVLQPPLNPKVGYVFSPSLLSLCNKMAQIRGRAALVHSLIKSYRLLDSKRLEILIPQIAHYNDLISFHDSSFINYLREMNADVDEDDEVDEKGEDYGLMYDCPPVKRIYDFVVRNVGSTLAAARALTAGRCGVALNWFGGWHHAQRDRAAGFCYANDVVIAIQEMKKLGKVLYVDLDLHHGDGVQEAFRHTDAVMTVSLHKFEPGFFPGTGAVDEVGLGKGVECCINVPLKDGITDWKYFDVFKRVMTHVKSFFHAGAVVIQCGADGIFGDPHRAFNLTPSSLVECVRWSLKNFPVPALLLGGGGYHHANTARCWTALTAAVLGAEISEDIPEECSYFDQFGPDFTINVTPGYIADENSDRYLDSVVAAIMNKSNSNEADAAELFS